uniref:Capsid protein n=1 Tax=Plant associated genomovirus 13 TaxID=2584384 RepID=A0A4Y5QCU1_9VIRU|nr:capsid protein [Plant associated genomovirus 13]
MAYRRKYSSSRAKRPTARSVKRGGPRRRYPTKKRTYRKKAAMSKKRILNISSTKKRDNMLPYTNLTNAAPDGGTTYVNAPAILTARTTGDPNVNSPQCLLWCATARDLTRLDNTTLNNRIMESARTATTCYMVGLKERIDIQVSSGLPWQWRRICFTIKATLPGSEESTSFYNHKETSAGYMRVVNSVQGDRNSGQMYSLFENLFAGQNASDWLDPMVAKTDQMRCTIKYDKTVTIASGNERGMVRAYNRWHPMKKNLVYNDDERGETITNADYSTSAKAGMGDYYVCDLFRNRIAGSTTDQLIFSPSATLYWHER